MGGGVDKLMLLAVSYLAQIPSFSLLKYQSYIQVLTLYVCDLNSSSFNTLIISKVWKFIMILITSMVIMKDELFKRYMFLPIIRFLFETDNWYDTSSGSMRPPIMPTGAGLSCGPSRVPPYPHTFVRRALPPNPPVVLLSCLNSLY